MNGPAPRAGDVAAMLLPDGAYGACHVTAVTKHNVTAYVLDWHSPTRPALGDLAGAGPLELDHHAHRGGPYHINIGRDGPLPPSFTWVGNLPVPPALGAPPNSYSDWTSLSVQAASQHRWDHVLPEPVRRRYKQATARGTVEVDFGAGPVSFAATAYLADHVPPAGPVRWDALDLLGRCTHLTWTGPDRGLLDAVAARPIITSLTWRDAPETVDLTGTGLLDADVAGPLLRELRLPRSVRSLTLTAPDPSLRVVAADDGRWLRVTADGGVVPAGLRAARTLTLTGGGTIDAGAARHLTGLAELHLSWREPPGVLTGDLGPSPDLVTLVLDNAYGLAADTLPGLPALTHLAVDGLRRSVVPALKARYRGTPVRLLLSGAKNDLWLAANLDNPFRDWVDQDARGGAAACRAYATAVRAVDRAATTGADPVPALRTLIESLNRLDFLDTIHREEAGEAFDTLVARAGLPAEQGYAWFDDWRDF